MRTQNIQALMILFSLIIIVFLYQLPTSVIKTKKNQDEIQGAISVEKALGLLAVSYTHLTLPTKA